MIYCSWKKISEDSVSLRHVTVDAIVLNKERNKVLLVKRAPFLSNPDKWVLPGGYLDREENTIQGVLRELREETGYDGKIINLFRVNDDPDRAGEDNQNVDFVYLIEADKKIGETDEESCEVKWFYFDEIPNDQDFGFDHHETVRLYLEHLKKPFSLPIFG